MGLVYLIRHAESHPDPDLRPEEWRLTSEGHADAGRLAERREWKDLEVLGSSTEPKALETAQPLAERWDKKLVSDQRFGEVLRPWAESQREFEEAVGDYLNGRAMPGWESMIDASHRFSAALDELREGHSGDVAVVSHGTIMAVYLTRELGLRVRPAEWVNMGMPDICVVDPDAPRILRNWGQTRF